MCGILGQWQREGSAVDLEKFSKALETLRPRGPDGHGIWRSRNERLGLGHTRLSIIDLNTGGQPMHRPDLGLHLVFNGEIYNFRSVREELRLRGYSFQTESDSEVILVGYAYWGIDVVQRLRGMFAFAIYDERRDYLFLARDPTGIKPLYYSDGESFIFSSEINAVHSMRNEPVKINSNALFDYLLFGYSLPPNTIYEGILELEPGCTLTVSPSGSECGRFWEWNSKRTESIKGTKTQILKKAQEVILASIEEHLVSDVSLGAFLSGGVDSSLIVTLLKKDLGIDIPTYTVSFSDREFDESKNAKKFAEYLKIENQTIYANEIKDKIHYVEQLFQYQGQPFSDSSSIAFSLLSSQFRKYHKVALSGDGGDEMFGGYPRFRIASLLTGLKIPRSLANFASESLKHIHLDELFPNRTRQMRKILNALPAREPERILPFLCYFDISELNVILHSSRVPDLGEYDLIKRLSKKGFSKTGMGIRDFSVFYALPGDYLKKVDLMSAHHGLEVRVPLLGKQVLDFCMKLARPSLYNPFESKILLKALLNQRVPRNLLQGKKMGFSTPMMSWLSAAERKEIKRRLLSEEYGLRGLISDEYLTVLLDNFESGNPDLRIMTSYNLGQRVYNLWSLGYQLRRFGI